MRAIAKMGDKEMSKAFKFGEAFDDCGGSCKTTFTKVSEDEIDFETKGDGYTIDGKMKVTGNKYLRKFSVKGIETTAEYVRV